MNEKSVLVTGAAGSLGKVLREGFHGAFRLVRSTDLRSLAPARDGEEVMELDLLDGRALLEACRGIDTIVHLAAAPEKDNMVWDRLVDLNIRATRNVYEAARRTRVRHVVYASSNHVNGFYRPDDVVTAASPPRPDSLYAVTKVLGEALGRLYFDKFGIATTAIRIGSFQPKPVDRRMLSTWLSYRDGIQLFRRAIEAGGNGYSVHFGVSGNRRAWVRDPEAGARLGFAPQDDAEAFAAMLEGQSPGGAAEAFQGGGYCIRMEDGETNLLDTGGQGQPK